MKNASYLMMVSVVAGLASLLSCTSNGNNVYGPSNSGATMTMTGTYRVSGDSLYVATVVPADTMRSCLGDSLHVLIDSGYTQPESGVLYSISNNTMILTESYPYMNGTGYTIAVIVTFSRAGTGMGVEGTWNLTSESYTVQSGTAPDSVLHEIDSINTYFNQKLVSGEVSAQYTFSGNQLTAAMSYEYDWANYFVSSWTSCSSGGYSLDTCSYNVTVVKVSRAMAQLHGKTSDETVTITWDAAGDETYSSSDTSHHSGTYYMRPLSCPNSIPAWYVNFLAANIKAGTGLLKKSDQYLTIPKKPPQRKWFMVF